MGEGAKRERWSEPRDDDPPLALDELALPDDLEPPPFPDELAWDEDATTSPPPAAADGFDMALDAPLPRISIAAFCDTAEVAEVITAASSDRRMARTSLTVDLGGIDAAVVRLSAQASPSLLILESSASPHLLLRALDRLAQVVDPGAKVLVIGAANDIALYRELMRRGVSEYLVPPIAPLQLIHAIAALYRNPDAPFAGRLVAVTGAKGGVGASTIAHNIAWALAERRQINATLVDLDLAFGTTALDFNQDAPAHVTDALAKGEGLDETLLDRLMVKATERLGLLLAPANLQSDLEFDTAAFEILLERVRGASPFVVLDLPHLWSSWMRQTLLAADEVVLVTTPDLAGLRNAKNAFDLIRGARPYDPPPKVVLNMLGVPKRPEIPLKDFAEALGARPFVTLPFEPALFGLAANNGQMLFEAAPQSAPALAIEAIVAALSGREAAPAKKLGLFERLIALTR